VSRFAGKGVVVTGAAQGIGAGLVRAFLGEGAGVVAFDKQTKVEERPETAEEMAAHVSGL